MQFANKGDEEKFNKQVEAIEKFMRDVNRAARMEKALLAIKEIVGDREYPDECGWDTFDQIRDALDEGLKEDNDVQKG